MSDPNLPRSRSLGDLPSPTPPLQRPATAAGREQGGGVRAFQLQPAPMSRSTRASRMPMPVPQQGRRDDQNETLHRRSDSSSSTYDAEYDEPRSLEQPSTSSPVSRFNVPRSTTHTTLSSAPTSFETSFERIPGGKGQIQQREHQRQVFESSSVDPYAGTWRAEGGPSGQQKKIEEGHTTTPEEEPVDLGSWAPENQLPVFGRQPVLQLPDFLGSVDASTSLRLSADQVQKEMEESINNLLSEKVFHELMLDPLGRHRFREYLYNTSRDVDSLDLFIDLTAFKTLANKIKATSVALYDVLAMSQKASPGVLSNELKEDILGSLRQGMVVGDSLDLPQQQLLHSLYTSSFSEFIRHKLVEEASIKLGQVGLDGTGLAEAFCLTNPRLRDHPIVLVSPGFERLTGYKSKEICGRNCRFLTGPATSSHTSKRISNALNRGEGINTLILNYKRDGTPFWDLLSIIPLRDTTGQLTYFIGGQTEVTGSLARGKNLSWLVGSEGDPSERLKVEEEFSPSLRAYASAMATGSLPKSMFGTLESESFCAYGTPAEGLAGGQVPKGRSNEYSPPPPTDKKKQPTFKGLFRALTGKKETEETGMVRRKAEGQQFLGGAESLFSKKSKPVELQIAQFASAYSKLLIFRRKSREILFTTAELLAYCGLPSTPPMVVYRSELIHTDILSLLCAPERGDWKMTRRHLKDAISNGRTTSLAVGIKTRRRSQYDFDTKYGTLHLAPLADREGVVEAFVAIFG